MTTTLRVPPAAETIAERLKSTLGSNLHSLVLYGSAVRGDHVEGRSDVDLLIVLEESTPAAHAAVAHVMQEGSRIDPLIVGRRDLERTFAVFGVKFLSIKRNHKVLHGPDPLENIAVDESLMRFLTEQGLRNLHLRLVHGFVRRGSDPRSYTAFVIETVADILVDLSEPLRRAGIPVPNNPADRVAVIAREYGADAAILTELLALRKTPRTLTRQECADHHARIYTLVETAVRWGEARWPSKTESVRR